MTYTINPNAKNVWIRDNEDTTDLSPITDASSVYLENGRTLEQELGEGFMVSNVAIVDTSMSKVIDGTLDGAYESCLLRGNTKFIDNDTGEVLDTFEEGRNLSLVDVKMPILRNVGKNLFEDNVAIQGYHNGLDTFYNDSNFITYKNPISVIPNTEYIFGNNIQTRYGRINFYDKNMKIISSITDQNLSSFTTPSNCHFVRFSTYRNTGIKPSEIIWSQLEVGRIATPYENHKTNILHTPETVTLRSLPNGVRDELNLKTGEYIKRIGEVVLDGSEDEGWRGYELSNPSAYSYYAIVGSASLSLIGVEMVAGTAICDKLKSVTSSLSSVPENHYSIASKTSSNMPAIIIRLTGNETTIGELKTYLQQNPITVQYELTTPVITTVDPIGVPFAYENGHVILESGYEGQSLLPTLEYSTVVNKTGQVQSIAKTIMKQEKQLSSLEKMLIQNIIGMDYNNTLLTLNLEIDEVM